MKKLVVFLRHTNDIDHITPILYKWLKTTDIPVVVHIPKKYRYDHRLMYLKNFFMEKIKINIMLKHVKPKWHFDTNECVVAFDWVMNDSVKDIIGYCKKQNWPVISLPHGDSPYVNRLETIRYVTYDDIPSVKVYDLYDYIFVPNYLIKRRFEKSIGPNKIRVCGSPRYCNEWMQINPRVKENDFNIDLPWDKYWFVMYTRNIEYPLNYGEIARVIRLVASFEDVFLVVKRHSRSTGNRVVEQRILTCDYKLRRIKNLMFTNIDDSMIDHFSCVLDMGTSMSWEAVKNDIPVLCLDLVHSNRSTIGHYIENCRIDTRDKLYNTIDELNKNGYKDFYDERQKKKFIDDIIDYPDENVLERYCGFIGDLF